MEYKEITKLINNVIENEFNHVQEYREREFMDTDKEQIKLNEASEKLFKQLLEGIPEEYKEQLNDYNDALLNEWTNLCIFYFKAGAAAGLTNLQFLKDIEHVGNYI